MPFEWRVFELAKEPEHPEQNQDAWWLNAQDGVAAIADGVTSGLFSRQWAQILTRAAVADWPDPSDEQRFPGWLADLRGRWEDEIDTSGLAWYQRAKLREGGFSTLVWLRLLDNEGLLQGKEQSPVEVMAIGDSCLFHVRDNELLESFPLDASQQFDSSPLVLGSVDLKRDDQLRFERLEISCRAGDMLVLCTDAVAAWAVERHEQGEPVLWSDYWDMSPDAWAAEVCSLRYQSKMRYDDATLVLLRAGEVAGMSAEEYAPPTLQLPQDLVAEADPDVDLLAVDDWQEPTLSGEAPAETIAPDEPSCVEPTQVEPTDIAPAYVEPDTYGLQTPTSEPEPQAESETPPPLPPGAAVPSLPPPPPSSAAGQASGGQASGDDWRDQVNTFSERLFKKVSEGLSRGVDKLQEAKDSAVKKLREKTEGSSEDDGPGKPGT